jgi:nucleotide-binding universal stress UspA family protein
MEAIRKILFATDFSPGAEVAAATARQLAQQMDAALEVVTVVDTSPLLEGYGDVAYREERIAAIRGQAREKLESLASELFAGVPGLSTQVRDGYTSREIIRAAQETGAGMIVMGTHGRTGIAHLLIGSITEKVVRSSPIPVVTVRRAG